MVRFHPPPGYVVLTKNRAHKCPQMMADHLGYSDRSRPHVRARILVCYVRLGTQYFAPVIAVLDTITPSNRAGSLALDSCDLVVCSMYWIRASVSTIRTSRLHPETCLIWSSGTAGSIEDNGWVASCDRVYISDGSPYIETAMVIWSSYVLPCHIVL